jgi:hypothetical protein
MAGLSRDKPVLLGETIRLLDELLADSDLQSSVSYADITQEVLIQEASDNEENSDDDNENVHALPHSEV